MLATGGITGEARGVVRGRTTLFWSTLAINLLSLALPIATLKIYDRVLPYQGLDTLNVLIVGVFIAILLELLMKFSRSYIICFNGAAFAHVLTSEVVARVGTSDLEKARVGEKLNYLSAIGNLKDYYNGYGLVTVLELAFVPLFLALIFYIGGALVLVPGTMLLVFGVMTVNGEKMRRALDDRNSRDDNRFNIFIDGLGAAHSIKALALERRFERRYEELQRGLMFWARYQDFRNSAERVKNSFDLPPAPGVSQVTLPPNERSLSLQHINFTFESSGRELFRDLSLNVAPGEYVSISGDYGSGKSTLLKIISGTFRPNAGSVILNGLDISQFPRERVVDHLGLIEHEGVIFRGTIRDNITRFSATPYGQAMFVAALLGVDKDIAALPAGVDTMLEGTDADTIPPGFKQRLTLVRALATKPRLILFDNADQALDQEGYALVHRFFGRLKGKATVIFVTDDVNLRALCDRDLWLADGQLREGQPAAAMKLAVQPYREIRL